MVPEEVVEEQVREDDIAFVPAVFGVPEARLSTLTVATEPVSVWHEIAVIVEATGIRHFAFPESAEAGSLRLKVQVRVRMEVARSVFGMVEIGERVTLPDEFVPFR